MPPFLSQRHCQSEWMDHPRADPAQLRSALSFIRRVNALLVYTRSTLHHLQNFSRTWKRGQRIGILDLATGSADIPQAILRWAALRHFDLHIVGIDLHPAATATALARNHDSRLQIIQADALNLPFAPASFDYTITALFLHHLDDGQIIDVLSAMNRLSRRGVIIADLLRNRRAYIWIKLLTALANPMVRHDAPASVAQAFTKPEILSLTSRAGLNYAKYFQHFGHRFVLAGEKASAG